MFRTAYSEPLKVQFFCEGPSLTHPEFKEECDINVILSRWSKTGMLEHTSSSTPDYLNLPDALDYHHALNVMMEADDAFKTLSGAIRARFNNNPIEFLTFCENPANELELRSMGLLNTKVEQPIPLSAVATETEK